MPTAQVDTAHPVIFAMTDYEKVFMFSELFVLPKVGDYISTPMQPCSPVGQVAPQVFASGLVVVVKPLKPGGTLILIQKKAMGWTRDELIAFIETKGVGYHPDFGRVEGTLVMLHPSAGLVGIQAPQFTSLLKEIERESGGAPDDGAEDEEEAVVYVDEKTFLPDFTRKLNPRKPVSFDEWVGAPTMQAQLEEFLTQRAARKK